MSAYFFVPEEGAQRFALIGLACVWAALLFGGMAYRRTQSHLPSSRDVPALTRILSSFTLVLAGGVWLLAARETPFAGYGILIAVGMTLGFLGDLVLSEMIQLPQSLLWGMGLFGVGHVCYIYAVVRLANRFHLAAAGPRWAALGIWLMFGIIGWFVVMQRGRPRLVLRVTTLLYALLLSSMAGVTTSIAFQDTRFVPLALGGGLFLLSDLLLAGEQFGGLHTPVMSSLIWLTYGPAQALIVYSVGSALALAR